jgi:hypothetical protein
MAVILFLGHDYYDDGNDSAKIAWPGRVLGQPESLDHTVTCHDGPLSAGRHWD